MDRVAHMEMRLRRALLAIPYAASRGVEGVRLGELAEMLEVDTETLAAEIDALTEIGARDESPFHFVDLVLEGHGPDDRLSVRNNGLGIDRPPRLTHEEAFALLLGTRLLHGSGVWVLDDALRRARTKLQSALGDDERKMMEKDTKIVVERGGLEKEGVLSVLQRAHRNHLYVQIDYTSLSAGKREALRVAPWGIANVNGFWYVIGHCKERGAVRTYKVERISGIKTIATRWKPDPKFDLHRQLQHGIFVTKASPSRVTLRARGAAARHLREAFKSCKTIGPDEVEVSYQDYPSWWLASWVLRLGPEARVIAPKELAEHVRDLAAAVAAAHSG